MDIEGMKGKTSEKLTICDGNFIIFQKKRVRTMSTNALQ